MSETYREITDRENREALAFWGRERTATVTRTAADGTVFTRTFRVTRVDRKWLDKHGGRGRSWVGLSYGYAIEVVGCPSEALDPSSSLASAHGAAIRHVRRLAEKCDERRAREAAHKAATAAVAARGGAVAARVAMEEFLANARALQAQADEQRTCGEEIRAHLHALGVDVP